MLLKQENKPASRSMEAFARGLLATTCLTVACSAPAVAGTIVEGISPAPADFPNSPNGFLLPVGTTLVFGSLANFEEAGFDSEDWFEFQSLLGGSTFSLVVEAGSESGIAMFAFDDLTNSLGGVGTLETGSGIITGTVPADGNLVVALSIGAEAAGEYAVTLNAQTGSATPEPATLGVAGLALAAGSLAWRRRRKQ